MDVDAGQWLRGGFTLAVRRAGAGHRVRSSRPRLRAPFDIHSARQRGAPTQPLPRIDSQ
ncbi:hypothetical protein GCM10027287_30680 [Bordetella muralis]